MRDPLTWRPSQASRIVFAGGQAFIRAAAEAPEERYVCSKTCTPAKGIPRQFGWQKRQTLAKLTQSGIYIKQTFPTWWDTP